MKWSEEIGIEFSVAEQHEAVLGLVARSLAALQVPTIGPDGNDDTKAILDLISKDIFEYLEKFGVSA
jgi:hypothetical protein